MNRIDFGGNSQDPTSDIAQWLQQMGAGSGAPAVNINGGIWTDTTDPTDSTQGSEGGAGGGSGGGLPIPGGNSGVAPAVAAATAAGAGAKTSSSLLSSILGPLLGFGGSALQALTQQHRNSFSGTAADPVKTLSNNLAYAKSLMKDVAQGAEKPIQFHTSGQTVPGLSVQDPSIADPSHNQRPGMNLSDLLNALSGNGTPTSTPTAPTGPPSAVNKPLFDSQGSSPTNPSNVPQSVSAAAADPANALAAFVSRRMPKSYQDL